MPLRRSHDPLQVRETMSGRLVGPIGPLLLAQNQGQALSIYSYSEVLVCDYSPQRPSWVRGELTWVSSPGFPRGALKREHVTVCAWLCSLSGHGEEDTGWSVDKWDCDIVQKGDGDHIRLVLSVAIGGRGARLNRIGYTWTAYVQGPV